MRTILRPSLIHVGMMLLLLSTVTAAQVNGTAEVLTNDKVITMVKAGLPPVVIVSKIHASKTSFDTNTDELVRLQKAQVPTEIINAMVTASTRASASSTTGAGDASKADPNDPAAAHDAGIYRYQEKDGQLRMIQLEPSVSKQSFASKVLFHSHRALARCLDRRKYRTVSTVFLNLQAKPLQTVSRQPVLFHRAKARCE